MVLKYSTARDFAATATTELEAAFLDDSATVTAQLPAGGHYCWCFRLLDSSRQALEEVSPAYICLVP